MRKKLIVISLVIGMMAVPVLLFAENDSSLSQGIQKTSAFSSLREDLDAMQNDLARLHEEAGALAEQLQGTAHKDAAIKIQGHVASILQRTRDMEGKIDANDGGAMASFNDKDEAVISK